MVHVCDYGDRYDKPALFTPWTIIHFSVGVIAAVIAKTFFQHYGFLPSFTLFSIAHLCYEIKDLVINKYSFLNSVGDQYIAMWAYLLVYLLPAFTPLTCTILVALLLIIFVSPLTGKTWIFPTDSWGGRG